MTCFGWGLGWGRVPSPVRRRSPLRSTPFKWGPRGGGATWTSGRSTGKKPFGSLTPRRMGHMCSAVANPQPPTPTKWPCTGGNRSTGRAPTEANSFSPRCKATMPWMRHVNVASRLSCLTNTLAPFGTHGPSTALFQWEATEDASHVSAILHGVLDPGLGEVVFQDETWVWEGRATWSWDGTSSDGNFVPPGTYVVWAQALVDGAKQSVEKCLVAVRGR